MLSVPTTLPDGSRVRVRLPHILDRPGLHALHERLGLAAEDFDVAGTLRFDPRQEVVACATVWTGDSEVLVGYGAIRLGSGEPHLLVSDEVLAPGAGEALTTALRHRATRRAVA